MANKTTKIQVLHSNFPIVPSLDKLDEGVIAINNRKDKEKIYFRGEVDESGTTKIVEFDPTATIMKLVDQKIQDTDIGHLQDQIDIINGGDNVNGSFAHADKVLEDKLTPFINDKVQQINAGKGIKVTESVVNNNKSVLVETVVKSNDLVLSVDATSGLTSTIKMNISGNTISLLGRNDMIISSIVVPGMNLTFTSTDGIDLTNTDGDVTASLKIDSNPDNRLELGNNGLFSSRIINCGNY